MRDKQREKPSTLESFFWKVPGDVPGDRSQPDPYQGVRESRDGDYLGASRPVPGQSTRNRTRSGTLDATPDPSDTSNSIRRFNWLALLMLLLFVSTTGFLGYFYYFTADAQRSRAALSSKGQKVFEITLGKRSRTSKSKVRIITHVVVKGDTLWDIANKYVKDPFRYPELAKLSKIKNPDLIYPYDLVRIRIYEPEE